MLLRYFAKTGFAVERKFFRFRSDNQVVGCQMALASQGIAFAPACVAEWLQMKLVMPHGIAAFSAGMTDRVSGTASKCSHPGNVRRSG